MAQSFENLKQRANLIKSETGEQQNSAVRVGNMLFDIIEKAEEISESTGGSTSLSFPKLTVEMRKSIFHLSRDFTTEELALNPTLVLMRRKFQKKAGKFQKNNRGRTYYWRYKWVEAVNVLFQSEDGYMTDPKTPEFKKVLTNTGTANSVQAFPFTAQQLVGRYVRKTGNIFILSQSRTRKKHNRINTGTDPVGKNVHAKFGLAIRYDNPRYGKVLSDGFTPADKKYPFYWFGVPRYLYSPVSEITFTITKSSIAPGIVTYSVTSK